MNVGDEGSPALAFLGPRDAPRVVADRAEGVLSALGRPAALDVTSAWRVLAFAEYDVRRSFFEDVGHVPLGCPVGRAAGGEVTIEDPAIPESRLGDADAAALALRRVVEDAVAAAVAPARRVAVLLSGGLDSASVAATLVRAWTSLDRDPADLAAFTVVPPPEEGPGERARAEAAARHAGLAHHVIAVRPHEDPFAGCDDMLRQNDLPSDDGRFRHARDRLEAIREAGFDTVLTGDGGDEVFGGRWIDPWRGPSRARTALRLAAHVARAGLRPLRDRLAGPAGALARKARALSTPAWLLALAPSEPHAETYAPPPAGLEGARGERWARAYCARQRVLLSYWRAWGAALGLRIRSPLLATTVVRFATSLPPGLFRDVATDRPLLRRAMERDLPSVTARERKTPPVGLERLRDAVARNGLAWFEAHLGGSALERSGLAPRPVWSHLVREGSEGSPEATYRALSFASLGAWCRARGL